MPKTLLVADDSLTIRKVIGMVLALEDFQITAVDNGIDAIARAREMRPDLVIADVLMPGRSGYEVCETLKSESVHRLDPGPAPGRQLRALRRGACPRRPRGRAHHQALREPGIPRPGPQLARAPRGAADDACASGAGDRGAARDVAARGSPPEPAHGHGGAAPRLDRGLLAGGRPAPRADRRCAAAHARTGRHPASGGPGSHADGRSSASGGAAPRTSRHPAGAPGLRPAPAPGGLPRPPQQLGGGTVPGAPRPGMPLVTQSGFARPAAPMTPGGFPRAPGAAPLPPVPAAPAAPATARGRDPFGLSAPANTPVRGYQVEQRIAPPAAAEEMSLDLGSDASPAAADGGEAQLREALGKASREVIEKIAWEVVPQLAETIVREIAERTMREREGKG